MYDKEGKVIDSTLYDKNFSIIEKYTFRFNGDTTKISMLLKKNSEAHYVHLLKLKAVNPEFNVENYKDSTLNIQVNKIKIKSLFGYKEDCFYNRKFLGSKRIEFATVFAAIKFRCDGTFEMEYEGFFNIDTLATDLFKYSFTKDSIYFIAREGYLQEFNNNGFKYLFLYDMSLSSMSEKPLLSQIISFYKNPKASNGVGDYVAITYIPKGVEGFNIKNIYASIYNETVTMEDGKMIKYSTEQTNSQGKIIKLETVYSYNKKGLLTEVNYTYSNKKNGKLFTNYLQNYLENYFKSYLTNYLKN
jgi:hypothetical protein